MRLNISFFSIFILLILLIPYTGVAYFAYPLFLVVLILILNKFRISQSEIIGLAVILIFVVFKILEGSISHSLLSLKYFYGFSVFYLVFRQNIKSLKVDVNFILIAISVVLILEAILINTVLPLNLLPHFPSNIKPNFSIYQRPYGIGTNASITSTLIVCLLLIRNKINRNSRFATIMSVLAIIISASGVGYGLLLLYFLLKTENFIKTIVILMVFVASSYFLIFYVFKTGILVDNLLKISPEYIKLLIQIKTRQIIEIYSSNTPTLHEILFGQNWLDHEPQPLGGDFGYLNVLAYGGILTYLLYFLIVLFKINKYNKAPLLILVIGAIHYAAIFSTPGQILFAFCLTLNEKKVKMYSNLSLLQRIVPHLKQPRFVEMNTMYEK